MSDYLLVVIFYNLFLVGFMVLVVFINGIDCISGLFSKMINFDESLIVDIGFWIFVRDIGIVYNFLFLFE